MSFISNHPVWEKVNPLKKPGHLLRISIARQWAKFISPEKFIGITGSVGKTTTTYACKGVLSTKYRTLTTQTNLDMIFNLPITILKTMPKVDKVVLEMGIEYLGEMDFYLSLVKPSCAIITKVSSQHTQFLGSIENIASEKGKLVESLPENGTAILNFDDPIVRRMSDRTKAKVIFFGMDSKDCHVFASDVRLENMRLVFGLNYGVERVEIRSQLLGEHNVYPLLAAAALGVSLDMPLTQIKKGLDGVTPPEHRMEVVDGINGSVILDDCYNAAPVAVEYALETLSRVAARRRIVVLGEMKELGDLSEKMHRQVAQKIFKEKPDFVFLGGGDAKFIAGELLHLGFNIEKMEYNLKNGDIVNRLLKILTKGDVVLVKGARSNKLEDVVTRLSLNTKK